MAEDCALPRERWTCHRPLPTHARKDVYPWIALYVICASCLVRANYASSEPYTPEKLALLGLTAVFGLAHAGFLVATYWSVEAYALARLGPNDPGLLSRRCENIFVCVWADKTKKKSEVDDRVEKVGDDATRIRRSKCCAVEYLEQEEGTYARIDVDKYVMEALVQPTGSVHETTIQFRGVRLPSPNELLPSSKAKGLSSEEASKRLIRYGKNEFALEDPKVEDFLREQLMSPFFLFQLFCMTLWMLDEYWYFALFTLVMLVVFEYLTAKNRKRSAMMLRSTLKSPLPVSVFRDDEWIVVSSSMLVPGDLIRLPKPSERDNGGEDEDPFPCDAWLVSGNCAMNEAMLTGESTPRAKEASSSVDADDDKKHDRHVLHGGTFLLPGGSEATAIVLRTGFHTVQGDLMRTILFSSDRVTVENEEAYVFMALLVVVATVTSAYVLSEGLSNPKRSKYKLLLHCVMIITSVVPPELPIELSLSVTTSLSRLMRESNVFCTEPHRIPFAGKLDVCAFDKTGTLTSDRVALFGVFGLDGLERVEKQSAEVRKSLRFCHEAMMVNGRWMGSPTDRAMIYGYQERFDPRIDASTAVLKVLPFDSDLKRMSVILLNPDGSTLLLTKGAPEIMLEMLNNNKNFVFKSTYAETYAGFMKRGFRVLTLACKPLAFYDRVETRSRLESNLDFLGFLVLENPLKPDTLHVMTQLYQAGHRCIMLTGDNPLTAVEIARRIGVMNADRALTGKELDGMSDSLLAKAVLDCDVFARVNPSQKERVMKCLKTLKLGTLMCGDGTNDVGALKLADVGISVVNESSSNSSSYEEGDSRVKLGDASLASPFTARTTSLTCVLDVVRQGRCSLVTYVQMFKILACNGLLSSFSMSALYLRGVKQGDTQGVVGGILVAIAFALLSFAKPLDKISTRRPIRRVFSAPVLASIFGQSLIHLLCLISVLPPVDPNEEDAYSEEFKPNQVNTVVFLMGLTVHAVIYLTNYRGHPFMESVVENKGIGIVIAAIFLLGALLTQGSWLPTFILSALELVPVKNQSQMLQFMLVDAACALAWEEVVVRRLLGG